MNLRFLVWLLVILTSATTASGQLVISPGLQFSAGMEIITLRNSDLINHGNFNAGKGLINFTGNVSSNIIVDQPLNFYDLQVDKKNGASVNLQNSLGVTDNIFFSRGFLNLNSFVVELGTTGKLVNEHEAGRVIGANGGSVHARANLNAPVNANPGNLGAMITSVRNMGTVMIVRGHQASSISGANSSSILRYYDIVPENNSMLNASLGFNYFNGELNGADETSLVFFRTEDSISWTNLGFSSRDIIANFVTRNGIDSFSRWTLSTSDNVILPVRFIFFSIRCEEGKAVLTWKTAREQNTDHFEVETGVDGTSWTTIGRVAALGNSSTVNEYHFINNSPSANRYYRIAGFDSDSKVQYTNVLRSSCSAVEFVSVWPNPVHERLFINIDAANPSHALFELFDGKGSLVKTQEANVVRGTNLLFLDLKLLANGIYYLSLDSGDGEIHKSIRVVKQ